MKTFWTITLLSGVSYSDHLASDWLGNNELIEWINVTTVIFYFSGYIKKKLLKNIGSVFLILFRYKLEFKKRDRRNSRESDYVVENDGKFLLTFLFLKKDTCNHRWNLTACNTQRCYNVAFSGRTHVQSRKIANDKNLPLRGLVKAMHTSTRVGKSFGKHGVVSYCNMLGFPMRVHLHLNPPPLFELDTIRIRRGWILKQRIQRYLAGKVVFNFDIFIPDFCIVFYFTYIYGNILLAESVFQDP